MNDDFFKRAGGMGFRQAPQYIFQLYNKLSFQYVSLQAAISQNIYSRSNLNALNSIIPKTSFPTMPSEGKSSENLLREGKDAQKQLNFPVQLAIGEFTSNLSTKVILKISNHFSLNRKISAVSLDLEVVGGLADEFRREINQISQQKVFIHLDRFSRLMVP